MNHIADFWKALPGIVQFIALVLLDLCLLSIIPGIMELGTPGWAVGIVLLIFAGYLNVRVVSALLRRLDQY